MRQLFAIARLAMSNAIRSRVVASLLALLVLAVLVLPLTIKSDGTLAGHVRIVLSYTLGLSFAILTLATVWAGCAAVSLEIRDKQAHLLMTKPVSGLQVWLGKWLGLLCLDALLLGLCGIVVYGMTLWTTRPGVLEPDEQRALREEVLVAMETVRPGLPDLEDIAEDRLADLRESGRAPEGMSDAQIRAELLRSLEQREFVVAPGTERSWLFKLDRPAGVPSPLLLGFRLSASTPNVAEVEGTWRIRPRGGEARDLVGPFPVQRLTTRRLAAEFVGDSAEVVVSYVNHDPGNLTVLFHPEDGLFLRVQRTGFEVNLLKALLILFARLALLAAVGLTAGSLFSTPVAMLLAFTVTLILQMGGYVESMAHAETVFATHSHDVSLHEPGPWDRLYGFLFKSLNALLHPLRDPATLEMLGTSQFIPWSAVGLAVVMKLLVYSSLLAGLASWLLGRREIGLPT